MSGMRLIGTATAMTAAALALALLTPPVPEMAGAVLDAQRTADTAGAEALLLSAAGLLAWGTWAWGSLGLLLTAASAVPGALGTTAHWLARVVLPGSTRRAAALALGLGLGIAGPVAGTTLLVVTAPAAAAGPAPSGFPDWPIRADPLDGRAAAPLPDWPSAPRPPAAGHHVVVRGDCLWDIAAAELSDRLGRSPTGAEVVSATHAWWTANVDVIGSDPDVLLPGQVLRPPST